MTTTRPECDTCHQPLSVAQAVVMVVGGVTYVLCLDCALSQLEDDDSVSVSVGLPGVCGTGSCETQKPPERWWAAQGERPLTRRVSTGIIPASSERRHHEVIMAKATGDVDRLDGFPRVGRSNRRAWFLLQRAKPFVLDCREGPCFVQGGVFATPIDEDGKVTGRAVSAATLPDPARRPVGR